MNYVAKASKYVLYSIFFPATYGIKLIGKKVFKVGIQVCSDEAKYGFKSKRK